MTDQEWRDRSLRFDGVIDPAHIPPEQILTRTTRQFSYDHLKYVGNLLSRRDWYRDRGFTANIYRTTRTFNEDFRGDAQLPMGRCNATAFEGNLGYGQWVYLFTDDEGIG